MAAKRKSTNQTLSTTDVVQAFIRTYVSQTGGSKLKDESKGYQGIPGNPYPTVRWLWGKVELGGRKYHLWEVLEAAFPGTPSTPESTKALIQTLVDKGAIYSGPGSSNLYLSLVDCWQGTPKRGKKGEVSQTDVLKGLGIAK